MKFNASQEPKKLSDAEFLALCFDLEDHMDSAEDAQFDSADLALNLTAAQESFQEGGVIGMLAQFDGNPELMAVLGDDPTQYEARLGEHVVAAQEAFLQDVFRNSLLGALLARKRKTAEYLKDVIPTVKEKMAADKDLTQNRISATGDLSSKLNPVRSAYLPNYKDFVSMAAALKKLFATLSSKAGTVENLTTDDFAAALNGSPFMTYGKQKKAASGNDWVLTVFGSTWGPLSRLLFDKNKTIAQRGWDADKLIAACDTVLELTKLMDQADAVVAKVKGDEKSKEQLKLYARGMKFFCEEAGYLGRGVVTAGRQATSGFIKRGLEKIVDK